MIIKESQLRKIIQESIRKNIPHHGYYSYSGKVDVNIGLVYNSKTFELVYINNERDFDYDYDHDNLVWVYLYCNYYDFEFEWEWEEAYYGVDTIGYGEVPTLKDCIGFAVEDYQFMSNEQNEEANLDKFLSLHEQDILNAIVKVVDVEELEADAAEHYGEFRYIN